ncbi:MAG: ubiquinol oxidase subunit II [Gammaproteobacteria bacterium]|nr:ubiquinol oxidase subunit II [Gammaproteobacteria bacterium]
MVNKLKNLFFIVPAIGLALLLSGCKLAILDPQGPIAAGEKQLLIDATLLMLIIVIPVILISWGFAWRYRASNKKATYRPDEAHNNIIEFFCWLVPCIIIIVLGIMTWRSSHELDPYKPLDSKVPPITIQVISLNWKWLFIYPDQHIATINFLQIPVNTPIQFLITSDAPMNSLEIPQLAGQIYAMGGMQTKLHIMGNTVGDYMGLSTNLSGAGFSDMNFVVRVSTQAQFDQWIKTAQSAPNKLTVGVYNKLTEPTMKDPVRYFSDIAPNLFHDVIMKFMMPIPALDVANDGTEVLKLGHKNV